ncbi:MAG TPA: DUF4326 domain-containing protein, partial [Burkholderiales bacterium]|nr:DUF4326 domain-containing protein [Burkholderiales bacterium]
YPKCGCGIDCTNTPSEAMKAHGGTTDAGAHGVPTPGSFGGLENREEVIAKPAIYSMRGGQDSYPCWAVRIDRRTKWGNPFKVGRDGSREAVIAKYEAWLLARPKMVEAVKSELRGKDLLCWCAPLPCHGDVLLRIANAPQSAGDYRP